VSAANAGTALASIKPAAKAAKIFFMVKPPVHVHLPVNSRLTVLFYQSIVTLM
jgi:hypothetical protein